MAESASGARRKFPNSNLDQDGIRREKAITAKRSRGGHLGRMTFLYNQMEQLMVDYNNVNAVKLLKEELDKKYQHFVDSNKDLLEYLDEDSETQNAIQTYESQTQGKLEFDEYYRTWLDRTELQEEQVPRLSDQREASCKSSSKGSIKSSRSSCSNASTHKSNKIKELRAKCNVAKLVRWLSAKIGPNRDRTYKSTILCTNVV